jgi:hypothetical protein
MGGDVSINEAFLMINFINLKITSVQSFKYSHREIGCVFMNI